MLFLLLMVGLSAQGVAAMFHEGYEYDYYYDAETEIMGMDNVTTQIQMILTPFEVQGNINTMVQLKLNGVTQFSHIKPVHQEMAYELIKLPFYFSVSDTGLVDQVYAHPAEAEDILVLKKSIAAAFSHRKQVGEGLAWSYSEVEDDHMGSSHHHYEGERTTTGYNLRRSHTSDDTIKRLHNRDIKLDHSGHIHAVDDFEEYVVHEDPVENVYVTVDMNQDAPPGTVLPSRKREPRLRSTSSLRFQDKRKVSRVPSVSQEQLLSLRQSELTMAEEGWREDTPGAQVFPKVNKLLRCTSKFPKADRRRVDCVAELMHLLYHVRQSDLSRWGKNILNRPCKRMDIDCIKSRETLINVIGQVKSAEAQRLIVDEVVRKDPGEEELKQAIFHLGAQDKPIQETFDVLQELCFGKDFQLHGVHSVTPNQRRGCLALGSVLRVHKDRESVDAMLKHVHTWLEKDMDKVSSLVNIGYSDLRDNVGRSQYIHTKHILLEALANAADPASRQILSRFAAPNHGHAGWRHAALGGLRKYYDKDAATALLNTTMNDNQFNVRAAALRHYKEHPHGFRFQQDDAVILEKHNVNVGAYRSLSRRSVSKAMCNLLERLTLDKEYKLPGLDWNKKIGDSMFGADFGVKMINRMHLHLSPVAGFFEVESLNSAWIHAKVKLIVRFSKDLMRAETCYRGDIRFWNISFVKDFAKDEMKELTQDLDLELEQYADLIADGVNQFNDLLGEWNIPELGLFDLDYSSPRAFIQSVKDGIENSKKKDWREWATEAILGFLEANGIDSEKFRGMFTNSKEWAKERFIEMMEKYFAEEWEQVQEAVQKVKDILQEDLGDLDWPLEILDKVMNNVTLEDIIKDPEGVGKELSRRIQEEIKDWGEKQETGLMGMVNKIVKAVRDIRSKLDNTRDQVEEFKNELLSREGVQWILKIKNILKRLQYFLEDDSANILDFFKEVADETGITLPYVSQLVESANKFMANAANSLSMSPQQAMNDITRALRQMKTALAVFANTREKLTEANAGIVGKLDSFMKLGGDFELLKKDLGDSIKEIKEVVSALRPSEGMNSNGAALYEVTPNGRGIAEKVIMKAEEVESAQKVLQFLEAIQDGVFDLNYLADNYQDGYDRVMAGLEVAKERFQTIQHSVAKAKEFVHKVFGVKLHPAFPRNVRDECDEVCECGMYPSHMYDRVGVQLMADEGDPIVCPFDGYVLVGKEHPDELIIRSVDEDLEDFEMIISHVRPDDHVTDIEEDEEEDGQLIEAGAIIGYTTDAPCKPNFIFVAQQQRDRTPVDEDQTTTPRPPPKDPVCGATKNINNNVYFAPVEEYSDSPFPHPKWVTHCSHAKWEHILQTFDLQSFADKFRDIMENLDRILIDMGKKVLEKLPAALPNWPDMLDPAAIKKMKRDIERKVKKFPKKASKFMEEKLFGKSYKWVDGLKIPELSFPDIKLSFPDIHDFFDMYNMRISELMDFLEGMDLMDKAKQLEGLAQDLYEKLKEKIMDDPFKFNPAKIRSKLEEIGVNIDGLNLDDLVLKFYEKMKACGSGLLLGQGSICDVDRGCADMICSVKANIGSYIERLNFTFEHNDCTREIWFSINDNDYYINYANTTQGSIEKSITKSQVTVNIKAGYELNGAGDTLSFSLSLTPCISTSFLSKCSSSMEVMKEYQLPVVIEIEQCDPSKTTPEPTGPELDDILNSKVKDFVFMMDRFGENRSSIFQLLDELRTTTVQTLMEKTGLNSSIDGNEIHNPQDIDSKDSSPLGEFDITFFRLPFKLPIPPVVFKTEIGAGGVVGVNFRSDIRVLSSMSAITLDPWVAAKAWGDGSATCAGMGGGVKLTGYLLETHFPFTMMFEYEKYPITITKKMDAELIPLRCKFEGYIQMTRFIKIKFKIFDWSADKLTGNIFTKYSYVDAESPPEYVGDFPPEDATSDTTRRKRSVAPYKCHVEQIAGRHPSDAAFYLEAPFHDGESVLDVKYAVGTFKGGNNVMDWQEMEGPTLTNVIQLKETGVPLHWTVKAKNTQGLETVLQCSVDSFDVTLPTGRMEANYAKTSHPNKISASMIVIDDSPLVEEGGLHVAVGVGEHYYGHSEVDWREFILEKKPINKEATGPLEHFAAARVGKLTSTPFRTSKTKHDYDCGQSCLDFGEKCVSFDYEYQTENCELHSVIQGPGVHLRVSDSYRNFERLGSRHSAWFSYDNLDLIHGEVYYINSRITNNVAYTNYLTSPGGIIVDFTPPEPGPVGDAPLDMMKHDGCDAAFNHGERCVDVTPNNNHRWIIDGPGGDTVFNGNWPKRDMLYTISNHYFCGNWDGFHDNETDLWAFTWSVGARVCDSDVVDYEDPHSHLADKSYWNHQGYASGLVLEQGAHYVTVQSLNEIIHGGALVTTVCHYTPLVIDLTPPILHIVDNVFFDEDFDIMAIYYQAYDPESGILRADFGLGETQHDVFVRAYSRHDPTFDGYEMITVDDVDLPHGVPLWVRIRPVNNVELLTAGHGEQPIMIDPSPPVAGDVLDGDQLYDLMYQPYDHRMCAQWLGWFDPESGINSYLWGIGSTPDWPDIMDWREYSHWHRSACVDVPLNHSQKYYNLVQAFNNALNSRSVNMTSDGVVVDMTDPVAGVVKDGFDRTADLEYSSHAATVQAYWTDFFDPESGIDKFEVAISVNGEKEKSIEKRGVFTELEDHTFHLKHNDFVETRVEATDGATRTSSSTSSGFRIDLTPPDAHFLRDSRDGYKYVTSDNEMYATWKYTDMESEIFEYRVRIFEHEGGDVDRIWPVNNPYETFPPNKEQDNVVETIVTGLSMKNGRKYSVEVVALNGAKLSTKHESKGVIVDTTPPVLTNVYVGFYGADEDLNDDDEVMQTDPETLHASWKGYDHESGVLSFMVALGKHPGDTSITKGFIDFGRELSGYLRDLHLNVTAETNDLYYVSVKAMNGAGAWSDVVSSRPIHVYGENVPGTVSDGRKADEDATYQQDMSSVGITFEGFDSPACGIRSYEWALGNQPGWSDIMPYTSVGIVMLNETHGQAQAHLTLKHGDIMYASVRAHTGHSCHEAIIHSSSDGATVDTEPPHIVLTTLGLYGMDSDLSDDNATTTEENIIEALASDHSLYQMQYDSIDLRWNATDDVSGVSNMTWMAGTMPYVDDRHSETETKDDQIPMMSVVMKNGETVMFSIQATDAIGNRATLLSPPLTIDTTPPVISSLRCTPRHLSPARSTLTCHWEATLDEESPVTELRIGVGTEQMHDDLVEFYHVKLTERTWSVVLPDEVFQVINGTCVVSVLTVNTVMGQAGAYAEVLLDNTPPMTGSVAIVTTETQSEVPEPRQCQRSITTMSIELNGFYDPESDIESYEVAVGSYEGGADIMAFRRVEGSSVTLDDLALVPGELAYATVKAINKAGLHSGVATSYVHVSPNPTVSVFDGLGEKDIDFQNDPSSMSGQVFMSYPCPIIYGVWSIHNLLGDIVMEETQFYQERFANDELLLDNMQTFYVTVEIMDALNRTFHGRSNGVTIYIQPPEPGEVRDGPFFGEDRNYQQSTSELSVNWDDFGGSGDIPGQRIEYYEVALGDDPAYTSTRSNTHYFVNVGLEKNYTFTDLRLISKSVTYYATVRAHAESGAYVDGTSNGIKAGFTPGMLPGNLELPAFSNSSSVLSVSWDGFVSDFRIIHYHWGISTQPLPDSNVTVFCQEYLPYIHHHFDVLKLQDAKENTVVTRRLLKLEHDTEYYVTVIAEDEPGQCIAAPSESVLVDLTKPVLGEIVTSGVTKQVQYLVNSEELHVHLSGFNDPESNIADFLLQLFIGDDCNVGQIGDEHHFEPLSEIRDVDNQTELVFYDFKFEEGRPYRIAVQVRNHAGSESSMVTNPIFVDTSAAVTGDVKDGLEWKTSSLYQPYTDRVYGTIAISPLGTGLLCRTQRDLMSPDIFDKTWTILNNFDVFESKKQEKKLVQYQDWNVNKEEVEDEEHRHLLHLKYHRNISLPHLEGGAVVSDSVKLNEGKFTVKLQASRGHNTVLSVTFSEGFLDDYTRFEMINYTDSMSDDDFLEIAESMEIDWDAQPNNFTESPATTQAPTPPPYSNSSDNEPIKTTTDVYVTDGFGLHFIGQSFGENAQVWFLLFWVRAEKQVNEEWILLDFDPADDLHEYDVHIHEDHSTMDHLWNIQIFVDGAFKTELTGMELPEEYSVKIRNWNHDNYLPPITDPFNPFSTESSIAKVLVPLPQDKMCHYGSAFYDMESGVEDIYIGLGNTTDMEDNLVPFHKVDSLCHPCIFRCDYYKCHENCTLHVDMVEGYNVLHLEMHNLDLYPGDHKPLLGNQGSRGILSMDYDFEEEANQTFFDSIRYHFMVKVVNEAGLETNTRSPGVRLDPTPPHPIHVVAVDPEFHMTLPATHQGHLDSLAAWWEFEEPESFITEYKVAVGTKPNGTELLAWTSMDLQQELLMDQLDLQEHQMYFFTVEATNAAGLKSVVHTDGIMIQLGPPNVDNATISLPGVDMDDVVVGENGDEIYFNPTDDSLALAIGGKLPADAMFIEWSIGLSPNDSFLMRSIAVARQDAELMEIKEGYFWYNSEKTVWSLREVGVRTMAESNATEHLDLSEGGRVKLEPGTCLYHHVYSMNLAHQKTHIPIDPMCVKGAEDQRIELNDIIFDVDFKRDDTEGKIKGKGIGGLITVSVLNKKDMEETYEISSNISYIPTVVNPDTTANYTSRLLHNRLLDNIGRGLVISPTTSASVEGPVEITISFDGVTLEVGQFVAIIYWNRAEHEWQHISEACQIEEQVDYTQKIITGWYCGEEYETNPTNSKYHLHHVLFVLHTIDSNYFNSPPYLTVNRVETGFNSQLTMQLQYEDAEGDEVHFDLENENFIKGEANLSITGELQYLPEMWYFGDDILSIILQEVNLPPVIAPNTVMEPFTIHIPEPSLAPQLYLETEHSLDDPEHLHSAQNTSHLFSGHITLGIEANETRKDIGLLYLCDVNMKDHLEIIFTNKDSNMTYDITEVTGSRPYGADNEIMDVCLEANLRIFHIVANSSKDYHGSDQLILIGHDDSVLYSQPLVVDVHTMIAPCVHGRCTGENIGDPECRSTDRVHSYAGYGCACDRGYRGEYCTNSHLLPFEIILIVMATASMSSFAVFMAVKQYRRRRKVMPTAQPEEMEMEEVSEYETDTDTSEGEEDSTPRNVEVIVGTGEAERRYQKDFKAEAHNEWLKEFNTHSIEQMTEINI